MKNSNIFIRKMRQGLLSSTLLVVSGAAHSLESGDWIGRIGIGHISINSSSSTVDIIGTGPVPDTGIEADDSTNLAGTIGYMVTDNWELELLLALPFRHDVSSNDTLSGVLGSSGNIATSKQLPPVLSFNYHFMPKNSMRPYVGAGINYTFFFDEKTTGALKNAGYTNLKLEDSFGLAVQAGIDIDITEKWFINAAVMWVDINTEAKISGASGAFGPLEVKDIELDPVVFIVQVGTLF